MVDQYGDEDDLGRGSSFKGDQFGGIGAGNDDQYQNDFRKTFITDNQKLNEDEASWTLHDIMIPGGQTAKLIRVPAPGSQEFRVSEVADRLKFVQPNPVIVLAGAMTQRAGKTMAGVTRAAFRTDAMIIDSGISSCVEKFCLRKNVKLIGVCPEAECSYPRLNPAQRQENELANGHTHFVLIGKEDKSRKFKWGEESQLKFELARRITVGRNAGGFSNNSFPQQKIVVVVNGDNEASALRDIETALNMQLPIVVLEGSDLGNKISQQWHAQLGEIKDQTEADQPDTNGSKDMILYRLLKHGKLVCSTDSSEEVASIVHLLLTITV